MATIHSQIESRIRTFVTELNHLVRQAAVDAVRGALGDGSPAPRAARGRPGRKPAAARAAHAAPAAPARLVSKSKGGRRSPEQMSKTLEAVRDYVVKHPGQRVEQIGPGLGLKTKDLARPISKLLDSSHLRREGEKRATKYFPGARASAAVPETSGGGRPKGAAGAKRGGKRKGKKG